MPIYMSTKICKKLVGGSPRNCPSEEHCSLQLTFLSSPAPDSSFWCGLSSNTCKETSLRCDVLSACQALPLSVPEDWGFWSGPCFQLLTKARWSPGRAIASSKPTALCGDLNCFYFTLFVQMTRCSRNSYREGTCKLLNLQTTTEPL